MKRITGFVLLFFLLTAYCALAQTNGKARLTGKIIDATEGDGLIGASVYIESLKKGVVTDRSGRFVFDGLEPNKYQVTFSYIGYERKRVI